MDKEAFKVALLNQIEKAKEEQTEGAVLDLRAGRSPYKVNKDSGIFSLNEIDDVYEFIKDSEEWFVDIYENIPDMNSAFYFGRSIVSWMF